MTRQQKQPKTSNDVAKIMRKGKEIDAAVKRAVKRALKRSKR